MVSISGVTISTVPLGSTVTNVESNHMRRRPSIARAPVLSPESQLEIMGKLRDGLITPDEAIALAHEKEAEEVSEGESLIEVLDTGLPPSSLATVLCGQLAAKGIKESKAEVQEYYAILDTIEETPDILEQISAVQRERAHSQSSLYADMAAAKEVGPL